MKSNVKKPKKPLTFEEQFPRFNYAGYDYM